jgi:hypothetical protein
MRNSKNQLMKVSMVALMLSGGSPAFLAHAEENMSLVPVLTSTTISGGGWTVISSEPTPNPVFPPITPDIGDIGGFDFSPSSISVVPEPGTTTLALVGVAALFAARRLKRRIS